MDFLVEDARQRGTPINKRRRELPRVNEQHDTLYNQWERINDELEARQRDGPSPPMKDHRLCQQCHEKSVQRDVERQQFGGAKAKQPQPISGSQQLAHVNKLFDKLKP